MPSVLSIPANSKAGPRSAISRRAAFASVGLKSDDQPKARGISAMEAADILGYSSTDALPIKYQSWINMVNDALVRSEPRLRSRGALAGRPVEVNWRFVTSWKLSHKFRVETRSAATEAALGAWDLEEDATTATSWRGNNPETYGNVAEVRITLLVGDKLEGGDVVWRFKGPPRPSIYARFVYITDEREKYSFGISRFDEDASYRWTFSYGEADRLDVRDPIWSFKPPLPRGTKRMTLTVVLYETKPGGTEQEVDSRNFTMQGVVNQFDSRIANKITDLGQRATYDFDIENAGPGSAHKWETDSGFITATGNYTRPIDVQGTIIEQVRLFERRNVKRPFIEVDSVDFAVPEFEGFVPFAVISNPIQRITEGHEHEFILEGLTGDAVWTTTTGTIVKTSATRAKLTAGQVLADVSRMVSVAVKDPDDEDHVPVTTDSDTFVVVNEVDPDQIEAGTIANKIGFIGSGGSHTYSITGVKPTGGTVTLQTTGGTVGSDERTITFPTLSSGHVDVVVSVFVDDVLVDQDSVRVHAQIPLNATLTSRGVGQFGNSYRIEWRMGFVGGTAPYTFSPSGATVKDGLATWLRDYANANAGTATFAASITDATGQKIDLTDTHSYPARQRVVILPLTVTVGVSHGPWTRNTDPNTSALFPWYYPITSVASASGGVPPYSGTGSVTTRYVGSGNTSRTTSRSVSDSRGFSAVGTSAPYFIPKNPATA